MSANPWDKFFWNDWENDPALKLCSLAAQGLWMRMLCICAKADPKGYLLVAGQPVSPADLATLVGKPESEVETLLSDLASKGVFSRDRSGRIYSRRMLTDIRKAKIARKNGKTGGNPSLRNNYEIPPSDNPPDKGEDKPHKPEAIIQKEKHESTKPARRRLSYPPDFQAFWEQYPTDALMSKKKAGEAWKRLDDEDIELVMRSLPAFIGHCRQHADYRPVHAVRYLSERRFEGFAKAAEQIKETVFVRRGTPQWEAWEQHYQRVHGKSPPTDSNGGWRFPSEFPSDWLKERAA